MRRVALVVVVVLGLVACSGDDDVAVPQSTVGSTTTTAPSTTTTTSVRVRPAVEPSGTAVAGSIRTADGRERTYRLYAPPDLPSGPVPLLVALHGGTGWGAQFELNSGFDGLAEANGFVVVYPDGVGVGADGTQLRTWNGGACCGPAARDDVDDVTFVDELVEQIESQEEIDPDRVFAAGHSNGGMLAYRLACELPDRIAAVGVQSTALEVEPCEPAQPVSVLHIHGTADRNVPIEGGTGPDAIAGVSFNAPIDGVQTLASADGCKDEPAESTDGDLTRQTWSGCDDGTAVEFLTVEGASHAWMGHDVANGPGAEPYMDLDSSAEIWAFLAAYGR